MLLRSCSFLLAFLPGAFVLAAVESGPAIKVQASVEHGPQKPSAVPLLPGLAVGKQVFYGPLVGRPAPDQGYQPVDGDSFLVRNGKEIHSFVLTSGMWWLLVGDRPRWRIEVRTAAGAYAQPGRLPDVGVSGELRASIELRTVATECLLGVVGMTLLEAP